MKILYNQTIFCPDNIRFERNLAAIKSFHAFLLNNQSDILDNVIITYGGYGKDEYFEQIKDEIKKIDSKIDVYKFQKNVGKAITVNAITKDILEKYKDIEYLWLNDADIRVPFKANNYFKRLIEAANKSEEIRKIPFGMLGCAQLEENCHFKSCWKNQLAYINSDGEKERLVWPDIPSGIAGGSIFIKSLVWNKLGGYTIFGCYGGDDAIILLQTGRAGYSWQVFDTLGVIHPSENDEKYKMWKYQVCQRNNSVGFSPNLSDHIKEADEFWSKNAK